MELGYIDIGFARGLCCSYIGFARELYPICIGFAKEFYFCIVLGWQGACIIFLKRGILGFSENWRSKILVQKAVDNFP